MKIFVDIDSVLNKLQDKWSRVIKEKLGEDLPVEQWTSWDRVADSKYQSLIREPGFFADIDVEEDAAEVLMALAESGDEIYILSAAGPWNYADKDRWIAKNFPFIPYKNIIFATTKDLLAAPDRVLIDDGPHNIKAWREAGGIAIVFDQPWNRELDGPRLTKWRDLLED